ncbi:hypothetical protein [Salinibacter ruber]|uniref:hypothetical protein n=1 Tax=Salinibacter ruber TaxID=146919 RepID=UPI0020748FB6|nr:hypothetical protein [Salinibacter ruber]
MRRYVLLLLSVALLTVGFLPGDAAAQNKKQKQRLRTMAEETAQEWEAQREKATSYAEEVGIPLRKEFEDGGVISL